MLIINDLKRKYHLLISQKDDKQMVLKQELPMTFIRI